MKIAEHSPDFASLRVLVDSLPALIHTGLPDGYLDFFNQRWLAFVGLRLEDLEGWKWTAAVHPDDVSALVAKWRVCIASGEPFEFESRTARLKVPVTVPLAPPPPGLPFAPLPPFAARPAAGTRARASTARLTTSKTAAGFLVIGDNSLDFVGAADQAHLIG